MDDKEYRRLSRIIDKLGKTWFSTLGFNRWKVKVRLHRGINEDNPKCQAKCHALWEYMDMLLEFWVEALEDMTEREVEEVFLHECCHGLVNEMREWTPDRMCHEEHVVTQLVLALAWAKHDGRQEGKKK